MGYITGSETFLFTTVAVQLLGLVFSDDCVIRYLCSYGCCYDNYRNVYCCQTNVEGNTDDKESGSDITPWKIAVIGLSVLLGISLVTTVTVVCCYCGKRNKGVVGPTTNTAQQQHINDMSMTYSRPLPSAPPINVSITQQHPPPAPFGYPQYYGHDYNQRPPFTTAVLPPIRTQPYQQTNDYQL